MAYATRNGHCGHLTLAAVKMMACPTSSSSDISNPDIDVNCEESYRKHLLLLFGKVRDRHYIIQAYAVLHCTP